MIWGYPYFRKPPCRKCGYGSNHLKKGGPLIVCLISLSFSYWATQFWPIPMCASLRSWLGWTMGNWSAPNIGSNRKPKWKKWGWVKIHDIVVVVVVVVGMNLHFNNYFRGGFWVQIIAQNRSDALPFEFHEVLLVLTLDCHKSQNLSSFFLYKRIRSVELKCSSPGSHDDCR